MYIINSSPTLTNCVMWGNVSATTDIHLFYGPGGAAPPRSPTATSRRAYAGTGNISADPLFVGGGDYGLQSGSPCIDSRRSLRRRPSTPTWGATRGSTTGTGTAPIIVDMGAYEYQSEFEHQQVCGDSHPRRPRGVRRRQPHGRGRLRLGLRLRVPRRRPLRRVSRRVLRAGSTTTIPPSPTASTGSIRPPRAHPSRPGAT